MKKLLLEMSSDLGNCPNYKIHESESAGFFLPMSEIISESSFLIKSNIVIVKKNIVVRSGLYISHRIFKKMDLADVGGYFNIRALKNVRTVHIYPLKIPRQRTRSV